MEMTYCDEYYQKGYYYPSHAARPTIASSCRLALARLGLVRTCHLFADMGPGRLPDPAWFSGSEHVAWNASCVVITFQHWFTGSCVGWYESASGQA